MANPFPFVASTVLTAAQLNGIGEASTVFTPTLTNATVGNGTLDCAFQRVNKIVKATYKWTLGSTSTITAGGLLFSLPVTGTAAAAQTIQIVGQGLYTDVSAGFDFIAQSYYASSTTMGVVVLDASGTFLRIATQVNGTNPVVPATGDIIRLQIVYEAA